MIIYQFTTRFSDFHSSSTCIALYIIVVFIPVDCDMCIPSLLYGLQQHERRKHRYVTRRHIDHDLYTKLLFDSFRIRHLAILPEQPTGFSPEDK